MGGSGNRTKLSPTLNKMLSSHLYSTNTLPKPYNSYFLLKLDNLDILPVKIACGRGCASTGGSRNRTKLSPTLNKMLSSHLYSTNTLTEPFNSSFLLKLVNLDILPVKIARKIKVWPEQGSAGRVGPQFFFVVVF